MTYSVKCLRDECNYHVHGILSHMVPTQMALHVMMAHNSEPTLDNDKLEEWDHESNLADLDPGEGFEVVLAMKPYPFAIVADRADWS